MTKSGFILFGALVFIITIILIIVVLVFISSKRKKKYLNELNKLESEKNTIVSGSLINEFNKVHSLINNDILKEKYICWKKELENIEKKDVVHITDKLIELENLLELKKFKELSYKIVEVELEIFCLKGQTYNLLESIRGITMSEERNRNAITKLKTIYRNALIKYNKNKNDYKEITNTIELGLENIEKLFSTFEVCIESNEYDEISKIVKALDDLIKNMVIVIDEAPTIIFMGYSVIPKRINEINATYKRMINDGYNLEYLSIDYNIKETTKKLENIFDKLNVLNLTDSIFELKTMLDYYDSLFSDFDNEKRSKKIYDKLIENIKNKIDELLKKIKEIYNEVSSLKVTYDLSESDLKKIEMLHQDLIKIKDSFKLASDRTQIKVMPYSRITNDLEIISAKLSVLEETLENAYKNLGSLKEDEVRAREQLVEIKVIIKESRYKIREYKLPVIPKSYYVQLNEAIEAVNEIMKELNKKPISIQTLNIRVDTARDLSLKLYNTAKEMSKTAAMSEMAIVYGNRYRSEYKDIESGIIKSEKEFMKGNYKNSLEIILNTLNIVEPGIHKKLMATYQE